jgi:hypothetical protein
MQASAIDLVQRCDAILASGEISENDAYDLADWLNRNDEACRCWPGEVLISELKQIWADAKVTKTELRKLTAVLRSIHKQWTVTVRDEKRREADLFVQQLASSMPPLVAEMPLVPIELAIRSHSDLSLFYNVDLSGPTCDCPDWRGYRGNLPTGHLTRCCKHVFDAFATLVPNGLWGGWIGAFIHVGCPAYPGTEWKVIDVNGCMWLASIPERTSGWMNFYTEEECFEKFGYSVDEGRWSYLNEPHCAAILLSRLHLR